MDRKNLETEHVHVKEVLEGTSNFISSEEFYSLSYPKRQLMTVRKAALETYLKTLSLELWGSETDSVDMSQLMIAGLATALTPTFPPLSSSQN